MCLSVMYAPRRDGTAAHVESEAAVFQKIFEAAARETNFSVDVLTVHRERTEKLSFLYTGS
jgi:hypothetical protein